MEDKVFGNLTFRVGWIKDEEIELWGKKYTVRVRTSSRKGDVPTEKQQKSYIHFKANLCNISFQTIPIVEKFVMSNEDKICDSIGLTKIDAPFALVRPKEILFFQNGKYAIICDTVWSDVGMAILYDGDKCTVDESYILEFEY